MNTRMIRLMSAVVLVLVLVVTGCSNGGTADNAKETAATTTTDKATTTNNEKKEEKPAAPAEKTKLSFWTFDRHDAEFINDVVEQYNATNTDNIEVQVTSMAENYAQSVDIAFTSKQAPDILRPNQDTTIPFVQRGYLEPLDSFMDDALKAKFEPTIQDNVNRFDGKIYTLPNFGYTLRLVYNVDLFKKANIQNPPTSLDELVETAKKLTEAGKADGQYGFALNFKSPKSAFDRSVREILQLSGHDGFGFDQKTAKFDFSHFKPVVEAFKQMKDDGSMLPGAEALDIDPLRAQFAEGKIGMYLSYSAEPGVYKNQFPTKINWAAAMAPTLDGAINGTSGFANSGQWLAISSQSEKKEAAWKFLSYMYSDEVLKPYHEEGYGLSAVPAVAAIANTPNIPGVEGFLLNKYDALWPVPPVVTIQGVNYGDAFMKYILLGGNIDETVQDLNKRYNDALDKGVAAGEVKVSPNPSFDPVALQGSMLTK
jgi:multiple sugar transport system substrate-binding protein